MKQPRIVGIGASAGGLSSLEDFLGGLPADTGLAFVVVQHLSRDHESFLGSLLDRVTPLAVQVLTEDTIPQPDTIYVRPPDVEVSVDEGLHVSERPVDYQAPDTAIDDFFLTLAVSRRERAIGVILSGMGTDGTRGAEMIKQQGGKVLVESVESAQFDSMPRTVIAAGLADAVGTPRQLADWLLQLVRHDDRPEGKVTPVETSPAGEAYHTFTTRLFARIRTETGVDFTAYRSTTLRRRVEKRMVALGLGEFGDYERLIEDDEEEFARLTASFLIGVTGFFRDEEFFEVVRERVVPQLLNQLDTEQTLRVWVPACSTGEEAYTYAMLIHEELERRGSDRPFKILASDVAIGAIRQASRGFYENDRMIQLPERYRDKYFTRVPGGYEIKSLLRERILFARHNLLADPPFIHIHLLSCRNFLIYVDPVAQANVLANFHFALDEGGVLGLGPSESPGRLRRAFKTLDRRWKIFVRKSQQNARFPIERPRPLTDPTFSLRSPLSLVDTFDSATDHDPSPQDLSSAPRDTYAQYLAERYAPLSLFVDRRHVIHYLNGDLEEVLHLPRRFARFTLETTLTEEIRTVVTSAVEEALNSRGADDKGRSVALDGVRLNERMFRIQVAPAELPGTQETLALVEFLPTEPPTPSTDEAEIIRDERQLLQQRLHFLEDQALQARRHAQKLRAELESTNEELQTSNRELLAANEEMQSTNEELQSVNEELYSVNNEIQRKNEELKRLNTDMNHLLESTEIGTLFLDGDLNIRRFTPTIRLQFDLYPSDIGRPLSAFSSNFDRLALIDICREVLDSNLRVEREVTDRNGNAYLLRVLPYTDSELSGEGLIVTFVNISDLVETRTELDAMARKYQAIFQHSADTFLVLNENGKILETNHWFGRKLPDGGGALTDEYFVDLLATDKEKVRFSTLLRQVIEEHTTVGDNFDLLVEPAGGERSVAVVCYPVVSQAEQTGPGDLQIVMVVQDRTRQQVEKQRFHYLLNEYSRRLKADGTQGGLMQTDGVILGLHNSDTPDGTEATFVESNTYNYLSASGKELLDRAIGNILEGSKREVVRYRPEDFGGGYPGRDMTVQYEPVMSGGKVLMILVKNLTDKAR